MSSRPGRVYNYFGESPPVSSVPVYSNGVPYPGPYTVQYVPSVPVYSNGVPYPAQYPGNTPQYPGNGPQYPMNYPGGPVYIQPVYANPIFVPKLPQTGRGWNSGQRGGRNGGRGRNYQRSRHDQSLNNTVMCAEANVSKSVPQDEGKLCHDANVSKSAPQGGKNSLRRLKSKSGNPPVPVGSRRSKLERTSSDDLERRCSSVLLPPPIEVPEWIPTKAPTEDVLYDDKADTLDVQKDSSSLSSSPSISQFPKSSSLSSSAPLLSQNTSISTTSSNNNTSTTSTINNNNTSTHPSIVTFQATPTSISPSNIFSKSGWIGKEGKAINFKGDHQ
jgi:hypothetical protein